MEALVVKHVFITMVTYKPSQNYYSLIVPRNIDFCLVVSPQNFKINLSARIIDLNLHYAGFVYRLPRI